MNNGLFGFPGPTLHPRASTSFTGFGQSILLDSVNYSAFTFLGWFRSTYQGASQVLLSRSGYFASGVNDFPFTFYLVPSGAFLDLDGGGDFATDKTISIPQGGLLDGRWHFFAVSFSVPLVIVQLDSQVVSTAGLTLSNSGRIWTIGNYANYFSGGTSDQRQFFGDLQAYGFYTFALNAQQIESIRLSYNPNVAGVF